MKHRNKLLAMRRQILSVYKHNPYYVDVVLASFASRTNVILLGYAGVGKTLLMECMARMFSENLVSYVQSHLSLKFSEVVARLNPAALLKGQESYYVRRFIFARVKLVDELQRLSPEAMSAMLRIAERGNYPLVVGGREELVGVMDGYFWVMATMNPFEGDEVAVRIPEPLLDRFIVVWHPAPYGARVKEITGYEKQMVESLTPIITDEGELVELWQEVESVEVPEDINRMVSAVMNMCRFCIFGEAYDASGVDKREIVPDMCRKVCGGMQVCSYVRRVQGVRAKKDWIRLAKGLAYLRGSKRVEEEDVEKAFYPATYGKIEVIPLSEVYEREPIEVWLEIYVPDMKYKHKQVYEGFYRMARREYESVSEALAELEEMLRDIPRPHKIEEFKTLMKNHRWLILYMSDTVDKLHRAIANMERAYRKLSDEEKIDVLYTVVAYRLPSKLLDKAKSAYVEVEASEETARKVAKLSSYIAGLIRSSISKGERVTKISGFDAVITVKALGLNSKHILTVRIP